MNNDALFCFKKKILPFDGIGLPPENTVSKGEEKGKQLSVTGTIPFVSWPFKQQKSFDQQKKKGDGGSIGLPAKHKQQRAGNAQ